MTDGVQTGSLVEILWCDEQDGFVRKGSKHKIDTVSPIGPLLKAAGTEANEIGQKISITAARYRADAFEILDVHQETSSYPKGLHYYTNHYCAYRFYRISD